MGTYKNVALESVALSEVSKISHDDNKVVSFTDLDASIRPRKHIAPNESSLYSTSTSTSPVSRSSVNMGETTTVAFSQEKSRSSGGSKLSGESSPTRRKSKKGRIFWTPLRYPRPHSAYSCSSNSTGPSTYRRRPISRALVLAASKVCSHFAPSSVSSLPVSPPSSTSCFSA